MEHFEDNEAMELAWRLVEQTGASVFLTGKAGTGKTTFLRRLREHGTKRAVVLAPTGIAAVNAGGVTIHSFFQLPLTPFLPGMQQPQRFRFGRDKLRLIRTMDLLVIDEVSMVRADLLDAVDDALRRHRGNDRPFGGVQLLLIGDLGQLAPVVRPDEMAMLSAHYRSPYFFSSHALQSIDYETVELTRVYRQNDSAFLRLLNGLRDGDARVLPALNARVRPGFQPRPDEGYIRLTTHTAQAQRINDREMLRLTARPVTYSAKVQGDFPESSCPADATLVLKVGAQVMFLRNDPRNDVVNGTMAQVVDTLPGCVTVRILGENRRVQVYPAEWENTRYRLDDATGRIVSEVQGRFTQMPLAPAWAITIHKSQGLTFDRAIIDAGAAFAHGQTYVALSRCRTLEGVVLESALTPSAIVADDSVDEYCRTHAAHLPSPERVASLAEAFYLTCLDTLFDMTDIVVAFGLVRRIVDESLASTLPMLASQYGAAEGRLTTGVRDVAVRFRAQYGEMARYGLEATGQAVSGRVVAAAKYFAEALEPFARLVAETPREVDNATVSKRLSMRADELDALLATKLAIFSGIAAEGRFSVESYLSLKARATASQGKPEAAKGKRTAAAKALSKAVGESTENPALLEALVKWRTDKAKELGVRAYMILPTKTLIAISNLCPDSRASLLAVPGIGPAKAALHGADIIAIVDTFR